MVKFGISLYCKILLQCFNNFVQKGGKRTIVAMMMIWTQADQYRELQLCKIQTNIEKIGY